MLVIINKNRQCFDARENWKSLEVPGIAGSPCRRQESAAVLDARHGSERRLDSLADNEATLNRLVRPQPNYTAGIWPQCLATDLLTGITDCGAVNCPRLTGYCIRPQRDHASMPSSARTPRTIRVPAQNRVDARWEPAECNTADREMPPYWRAPRIHGLTPYGERAARTRIVIGIVIPVG